MPTVDSLDIKISAQANNASASIDKLMGKLNILSSSLNRINGSGLTGLANGVNRLSTAMQSMKSVGTADFTRLAKNIEKLGNLNVANLNSAASSMSHLTRAFNQLGSVSANAQQVGVLASNLSKLGYKSINNAITNLPALTSGLNNLMSTLSRTPQVSNNVIQMTNALANLASQGGRVGTASRTLVNGLNNSTNAMNRAKKSSLSLAAAFGKFYATWFLAIRGLKGMWKSITGTADYIEAYNYFNVALGKMGSNWSHQFEEYGYDNAEAYAESFKARLSESMKKLSGLNVTIDSDGQGLLTESGLKNLGLSIQEVTQYASQLASVTNSIGLTGEVSLAAASSFTRLAGDISSLFNIDYSSVAKNLQSGLIGQSRALYKYGIDITNATLQTYAYELGLSKAVSEMTQAEKMQLRMLAILEQSKVSWGDLANTINSPSNMIRQFKNNIKETGMVLGQLFIPVLQKVMPIINGAVIAIKRLLVSAAQLFGIKIDFEAFGQGYSEIEDSFDDISGTIDGATDSAKKFKQQLQGFDELNLLTSQQDTGNGTTGVGAIDLTEDILKATSEYEKVWNEAFAKMENRANEYANKITKILKPIRTVFQDFAVGDFFKAGKDVSKLAVSITDFFTKAIDKVDWRGIGQKVGDFFVGINWTEALLSVGELIWQAFKAAFELYTGAFSTAPLETAIVTMLGLMKLNGADSAIANALKPYLQKINLKGITIQLVGVAIAFEGLKLASENIWKQVGNKQELEEASEQVLGDFWGTLYANAVELFGNEYSLSEIIGALFQKDTWDDVANNWLTGLNVLQGKVKEWWQNTELMQDVNEFTSTWSLGWDTIYTGAVNTMNNIESFFGKELPKWWNGNILPWFTKEKWKELGDNMSKGLKDKWNEFSNWWHNTGFYKWWNAYVTPWFTKNRWTWSGISDGLKTAFNNAVDSVKSIWNSFATWLNSKLTFKMDPIVIGGFKIADGATITLGKLPTFATGGFPEDGLFMANHSELVGQFTNGKTAVANNAQITEGIKQAAYEGMKMAISEYQTNNTNVNITLEGDANKIFKVVQAEARSYSKMTRLSPFPI